MLVELLAWSGAALSALLVISQGCVCSARGSSTACPPQRLSWLDGDRVPVGPDDLRFVLG
jgi:hypothetical protein